MVEYFSDNSNRANRAYQVWLILIAKATNRQTITYGDLAEIIGFGGASPIGNVLDYIFHYCNQNNLPPLTIIVVNKQTGLPGTGMGEFNFSEQEQVFQYDWYGIFPPSPDELQEAFNNR